MIESLRCEEPALRFWLRYAEREGALVEGHGDRALVLLPSELEDESGLPDEILVTDQPDVAREDGAALLIAGHPAIERATEAVLADGDTGTGYLPWPTGRPPTRLALQEHARELVAIEHARIDAAGEPIAAFLPLLRVGAVVNYTASLTLRFQEQEEAWIDARIGLLAEAQLVTAIAGHATLARADRSGRRLHGDVPAAAAVAHTEIDRRALKRRRALAGHAARARVTELGRADAYYAAALESIARRRTSAQPDRARMLDAQEQTTRAEHARRRREIEQTYEPRHAIRPFRLHTLYVPSWLLPIEVRRGARRFAFELCWVPAAGAFAPIRCPHCNAPEPLVAGRERLGCAACLVPASARPRPTAARPMPQLVAATPPVTVGTAESAPTSPRSPAGASALGGTTPAGVRSTPAPRRSRQRAPAVDLQRIGNRMAIAFWQCVADGERWPRQKAARDSPLRALSRLYGPAGPGYAIGIPIGVRPESVEAGTCVSVPGTPELTRGFVLAADFRYEYTLTWSLQAGKPVIAEVMPGSAPLDLPPMRLPWLGLAARLREDAPEPSLVLDPVARELWRIERSRHGLPLTLRCLAARWALRDGLLDGEPASAVAAAIAHAQANAAGARVSRAATARDYGVAVAALAAVAKRAAGALSPARHRGY
ncbi:MAG: hypothetical protein ACYDHH_06595 [Solirubrobacteraceae bacterium]